MESTNQKKKKKLFIDQKWSEWVFFPFQVNSAVRSVCINFSHFVSSYVSSWIYRRCVVCVCAEQSGKTTKMNKEKKMWFICFECIRVKKAFANDLQQQQQQQWKIIFYMKSVFKWFPFNKSKIER